jgi:hypothetical protein
MRYLVLFFLFPFQALAWEFSATPICTLFYETASAQIMVRFDPDQPEYQLDVTLKDTAWSDSPSFGMSFDGPRSLVIGTDRHVIDQNTLTVKDVGFGNVLNGLEFNQRATAFTQNLAVRFSLHDAAPAVRDFRDCATPAPALS